MVIAHSDCATTVKGWVRVWHILSLFFIVSGKYLLLLQQPLGLDCTVSMGHAGVTKKSLWLSAGKSESDRRSRPILAPVWLFCHRDKKFFLCVKGIPA